MTLLLVVITLLPTLMVMMTSFTKFVVSLSFLRTAMGTPHLHLPPVYRNTKVSSQPRTGPAGEQPASPQHQQQYRQDGLEALKAIRAADGNANVVMCSAMGQETMVRQPIKS